MKEIIIGLAVCFMMGAAACGNTTQAGHETNNTDTAVLVKDTANTLNAKPVNDTGVNLKTK